LGGGGGGTLGGTFGRKTRRPIFAKGRVRGGGNLTKSLGTVAG